MDDEYVELAKRAIQRWVAEQELLQPPEELSEALLNRRNGVFVTLHKKGELRGCIGTYQPRKDNLAQEIVSNAKRAASEDPRFSPVEESELSDLTVSVDVLSRPEPCEEDDLDPDKYGVIVSKGPQQGLLLPDLDGVETVDKQLRIAKRKAGIGPHDKEVQLQRFEVERHHGDSPIQD